jgi:hypothetical protein
MTLTPHSFQSTSLKCRDPEFLTPEEERELNELLVRNGRMDDVKRFVAANSDRFRMERVRR